MLAKRLGENLEYHACHSLRFFSKRSISKDLLVSCMIKYMLKYIIEQYNHTAALTLK